MKSTNPIDLYAASDAELVQLGRQGDQSAYGQIVERYQSLVCSVAYNRCGDLSLSEDLAQDAFILAWQKLRVVFPVVHRGHGNNSDCDTVHHALETERLGVRVF